MPTIAAFYGMVVQMFWRDHNPPHFHVRYGRYRALVNIADAQLMTGELPSTAERLVLEWTREHQEELMENWRLCEALRTPNTIAPPP